MLCGGGIDEKFAKLKLEHLTHKQKEKLLQVLQKHSQVFSLTPGYCDIIRHEIKLKEGARPVRCKPYRIPDKFREEVDRQLEELLQQGRIVHSDSTFASPMVVVVKKDNKSLRLCVNYKKLNDITETQPYSFPRVDDLTRKYSKFNFLTKLDAVSAFWQLSVEPKSRPLTAFITHKGLFEWVSLPYGLKGSSFTYQKMADYVLSSHRIFSDSYIDDIIVGANTFGEHLKGWMPCYSHFPMQA